MACSMAFVIRSPWEHRVWALAVGELQSGAFDLKPRALELATHSLASEKFYVTVRLITGQFCLDRPGPGNL